MALQTATLKILYMGHQATLMAINTVLAEIEIAKQEVSGQSRP
jgi:hypothetical protein